MDSSTVSKALLVYLGTGVTSFPDPNEERLTKEFGADKAEDLAPLVAALVEEVRGIKVDWSVHDLQSAGDLAANEMRRRHPELSDEAVGALRGVFTFDWR
jgi:hypothetical protein